MTHHSVNTTRNLCGPCRIRCENDQASQNVTLRSKVQKEARLLRDARDDASKCNKDALKIFQAMQIRGDDDSDSGDWVSKKPKRCLR